MTVTTVSALGQTVDTSAALDLDELFKLINPDVELPKVVSNPEEAKDGDMFVMADGLYTKAERLIGTFIVRKEKFAAEIPGLTKGSVSFVRNEAFPKIPGNLFRGIIRFYSRIYKSHRNEVMAQIWWNKATEQFEVEVPVQRVGGVTISYDRTGRFYEDPNLVLVMTSHSHHTMGTTYSGTDDKDERGKNGVYSFVFGSLKFADDGSFTYRTNQRVCYDQELIYLTSIEDIFDMSVEGEYVIPEEEYANVTESAAQYKTGATYYSGYTSLYANSGKTNSAPGAYVSSNVVRGTAHSNTNKDLNSIPGVIVRSGKIYSYTNIDHMPNNLVLDDFFDIDTYYDYIEDMYAKERNKYYAECNQGVANGTMTAASPKGSVLRTMKSWYDYNPFVTSADSNYYNVVYGRNIYHNMSLTYGETKYASDNALLSSLTKAQEDLRNHKIGNDLIDVFVPSIVEGLGSYLTHFGAPLFSTAGIEGIEDEELDTLYDDSIKWMAGAFTWLADYVGASLKDEVKIQDVEKDLVNCLAEQTAYLEEII